MVARGRDDDENVEGFKIAGETEVDEDEEEKKSTEE